MTDPFDLSTNQSTDNSAEKTSMNNAYLTELNSEQVEAVKTVEGPLLVLAGAGTGKTRVLTTRLAHILQNQHAHPGETLTVTFTNKAAREMRDRVAELVGGQAEEVWLGTFHALGARILRRHAELVGLKSNFSIIDQSDQERLKNKLLNPNGDNQYGDFQPLVIIDSSKIKEQEIVISNYKDSLNIYESRLNILDNENAQFKKIIVKMHLILYAPNSTSEI